MIPFFFFFFFGVLFYMGRSSWGVVAAARLGANTTSYFVRLGRSGMGNGAEKALTRIGSSKHAIYRVLLGKGMLGSDVRVHTTSG